MENIVLKSNTKFKNPLIEQRADPWIYKHDDGFYYFTGSYPEYDRIILRKSNTINGLRNAKEKAIWRKHEIGVMGAHIWAPEIHYINGRWYIYFAAGVSDDKWHIRTYVLENESADPMEDTWVEKGRLETNWDSFTLDATTFMHNGTQYLVWAQKDRKMDNNSNLYIAEMENPCKLKGNQVRLTVPEYDWECNGFKVNEGPAVIKKNGKIFISYSASATDYNYCMGLLSADIHSNLLDPKSWHKSPTPVFQTSEATGEYGPGHNCFTVSDDGEDDILVYHARPYKEIVGNPLYDHNRHTRVKKLEWNEDGTPNFGIPGEQ
ncbi:family 43 glycosylhydrolase [Clostridium oryzae]|uniref:Extracellular exo-alpha-(1->5)-L-arabinofuranosidase n=1 Tax=Clostridium oryzae TaxID=1450648 RepID=A0A1V4IR19_9CLOT|nr:glycoside hydrolase family 43 protein [Clostridium oryzae]OPJ62386.1 extracellular exo-alpha-(1->5)-L-arabinofuranosidase precursor [Clostridium oryzae]